MLSQDLGDGEFITGITPHERSYSGSLRQWDARLALLPPGIQCCRLGSVDDWPMAKPETKSNRRYPPVEER